MKKWVLVAFLVLLAVVSVATLPAMANPTFTLKVSVSGRGSGTVVDTLKGGDIFFEGTAFSGRNMQYNYGNSISASLTGAALKTTKHAYIKAKKLSSFVNEFDMLDAANTRFAVFNAGHAKLCYKAGVRIGDNLVATRDISLKASRLGWHNGYNLMTAEQIGFGKDTNTVSHMFTLHANSENVTFTSNSKVKMESDVHTDSLYGHLSYDLTYKASKMHGTMTNNYQYYGAGGETYAHGNFKNFKYVFSIDTPFMLPSVY